MNTSVTTTSSSPATVKAKQTNSKFGNGTLRFFLTKSKNVKMVKLVKVRWDLRPPNVKDHIPPSAARCVVERCERLVYSVQKAAKPKRRQGGKKKKKPTTSSGHVKGEIPDQRLAASETKAEAGSQLTPGSKVVAGSRKSSDVSVRTDKRDKELGPDRKEEHLPPEQTVVAVPKKADLEDRKDERMARRGRSNSSQEAAEVRKETRLDTEEDGKTERTRSTENSYLSKNRTTQGRRTNLSKIFNEELPAVPTVLSAQSSTATRCQSNSDSFITSPIPVHPTASPTPCHPRLTSTPANLSLEAAAGPDLEEIDSELLDLATSRLDYNDFGDDDDDVDVDVKKNVVIAVAPAKGNDAPPASMRTVVIKRTVNDRDHCGSPLIPVTVATTVSLPCSEPPHVKRLPSPARSRTVVCLQWWEAGKAAILDLADYRQQQQLAITPATVPVPAARKIDADKIEAKSPIICDLLRNGFLFVKG